METHDRPVVIGGGAAGLAACLTLEQAGCSPVLIEADNRLGGRMCTETLANGIPVDRGFQVLQAAYPELQRWTDPSALPHVAFVPGARVFTRGQWRTLADPRRAPRLMWATLNSRIGTWGDSIKVLKLVVKLLRADVQDLQSGRFPIQPSARQQSGGTERKQWDKASTMEFWQAWGFSDGFIRGFMAPFFSGIFLERAMTTPAAQFLFTFRMLAEGKVLLPRGGMAAFVDQLASGLTQTEVRLNSRVSMTEDGALMLDDAPLACRGGGVIAGPGPLTADEELPWNACVNVVFRTESPPFGQPIIGLIPAAEWVTNLHFMEDVHGTRAKGWLNVTAVSQAPDETLEATVDGIRKDLADAGLNIGEVEWSTAITKALPRLSQVGMAEVPEAMPRFYSAGDHTFAPSLNGALHAGRRAAESWLAARSEDKNPHHR